MKVTERELPVRVGQGRQHKNQLDIVKQHIKISSQCGLSQQQSAAAIRMMPLLQER